MLKKDIEKLDIIFIRQVARNMAAGADFRTAVDQTFNLMERDYPEVLYEYIEAKMV